MAVIVFFGTGEVKSYPRADAAFVRDRDFILTRWNGSFRSAETVETFDARAVILAEVYTIEAPVRVVEGRHLPRR